MHEIKIEIAEKDFFNIDNRIQKFHGGIKNPMSRVTKR